MSKGRESFLIAGSSTAATPSKAGPSTAVSIRPIKSIAVINIDLIQANSCFWLGFHMDFLIAHRVYECGIHQEKTSTRSNSVHWKSNCSMHFTTPRPITGKVDLCRCRPPPTRMAGNVDVVAISIVALLFYYSSIREFMAISRPGINYCSIWALFNHTFTRFVAAWHPRTSRGRIMQHSQESRHSFCGRCIALNCTVGSVHLKCGLVGQRSPTGAVDDFFAEKSSDKSNAWW